MIEVGLYIRANCDCRENLQFAPALQYNVMHIDLVVMMTLYQIMQQVVDLAIS